MSKIQILIKGGDPTREDYDNIIHNLEIKIRGAITLKSWMIENKIDWDRFIHNIINSTSSYSLEDLKTASPEHWTTSGFSWIRASYNPTNLTWSKIHSKWNRFVAEHEKEKFEFE